MRWTLSRLQERAGCTLRAAFLNLSAAPVRLADILLCETEGENLRCAGRPEDWLLSSLEIALRIGHLGEVLPAINDPKWSGYGGPFRTFIPADRAADGHWRIYKDWLTLYCARDHAGMVMGAVGAPVADVRFDCRVDDGRMRLAVVSQMSDVVVEPGETRVSQEVLFLAGPYGSAVETLLRWEAATHGARTHRGPVVGWCSWYDMLDKITGAHVEEVVKAAAALRDRLPLDVIQVDMGYERGWGDWRPNDKFPQGWTPIVQGIRAARATPGIWISPLGVTGTGLKKLENHPDWFQRRKDGSLIVDPGKEQYLDPSHPEVQAFIRQIVCDARAAGFEYFKIDYNEIDDQCRFHNPRQTRFEIYRDLYRLYREEMGESSYLLACAGFARAPLGFADAARVGWDSRARWSFKPGEGPICVLEALHCVGQSALANGILWANDPDVTYLKTRDTLTAEELRTWHGFVGLLGGATLISEPINQADHQAEARRLEILTPPVSERGRSFRGDVDRHHQQFGFFATRPWGDFAVVQLFNASDHPQSLQLTRRGLEALGDRFHVWSFWDERYLGVAGPDFRTPELAPHACVVLRLTPVGDDPALPPLIGSSLHLGMGAAEVAEWRASTTALTIRLNDGGARSGCLVVACRTALTLEGSGGCRVQDVREAAAGVWTIGLLDRQRGQGQTLRLRVAS
jgi:hypothetical protein